MKNKWGAHWRRPLSLLSGLPAWALAFYVFLAAKYGLGLPTPVALLLAGPVAFLLIFIGEAGQHFVAEMIVRWRGVRPVDVPEPPVSDAGAPQRWLREPRVAYPAWAHARAQCGWVALRLRVDGRGVVRRYRIIDQAPGRTFERAVRTALVRARVATLTGEAQEISTVITFVAPSEHTPEWARQRLRG